MRSRGESVDEAACRIELPPGHPLVVSPFDEQALEAALRIRDQLGAEAKITAVTLGPESARTALKQALALGADDGVHVLDAAFGEADSHVTAHALAAAIRRLGAIDLVLAGRQAADWDAGIVGLGVAEILGLPAVSFACAVEAAADWFGWYGCCRTASRRSSRRCPRSSPCRTSSGMCANRTCAETMRAARKPVAVWSAADLGLDASHQQTRGRRSRLFVPQKNAQCELIAGVSPAESGERLARVCAKHGSSRRPIWRRSANILI